MLQQCNACCSNACYSNAMHHCYMKYFLKIVHVLIYIIAGQKMILIPLYWGLASWVVNIDLSYSALNSWKAASLDGRNSEMVCQSTDHSIDNMFNCLSFKETYSISVPKNNKVTSKWLPTIFEKLAMYYISYHSSRQSRPLAVCIHEKLVYRGCHLFCSTFRSGSFWH